MLLSLSRELFYFDIMVGNSDEDFFNYYYYDAADDDDKDDEDALSCVALCHVRCIVIAFYSNGASMPHLTRK